MLLHWRLIFKHSEKFSNIIPFFQPQLNWAPLLYSNGYVLPAAHPQQSRTFQGPCDFPLCFPPPISQNHQAMWPQGYVSQGKYNKQALRWSAAAGRTTQCVKQGPDYTCRITCDISRHLLHFSPEWQVLTPRQNLHISKGTGGKEEVQKQRISFFNKVSSLQTVFFSPSRCVRSRKNGCVWLTYLGNTWHLVTLYTLGLLMCRFMLWSVNIFSTSRVLTEVWICQEESI